MNTTLPISFILPIKSSKARNFDEYFEKAIASINSQTVGIEELLSSKRKYEDGFKSDLIDNIPDLIKPERIFQVIQELSK